MPKVIDRLLIDEAPRSKQSRGIFESHHDAKFLINIKHRFLPVRLDEHIILEPYSPHRCAHEFRYNQGILDMLPLREHFYADPKGLSRCWTFLLRVDTGARFYMPATSRSVKFSASYHRWYHSPVSVCQDYPPEVLTEATCLERKKGT